MLLHSSAEYSCMSSSFEVSEDHIVPQIASPPRLSEDIQSKVLSLEARMSACEAVVSCSGSPQRVPPGGIVASRIAALESTTLSDATNVRAARFSVTKRSSMGDRDVSLQQLNDTSQLECGLRSSVSHINLDLVRLESEISRQECRVGSVEEMVNRVGEAVGRLDALIGVKERRITGFGASIGEACKAVEMLSKDVDKELQRVTHLTDRVNSTRTGQPQDVPESQRWEENRPMWQSLRELQNLVMQEVEARTQIQELVAQEREARTQGLQEVFDSIKKADQVREEHDKMKQQEAEFYKRADQVREENCQLKQQLFYSELLEVELEKRTRLVEERLHGMLANRSSDLEASLTSRLKNLSNRVAAAKHEAAIESPDCNHLELPPAPAAATSTVPANSRCIASQSLSPTREAVTPALAGSRSPSLVNTVKRMPSVEALVGRTRSVEAPVSRMHSVEAPVSPSQASTVRRMPSVEAPIGRMRSVEAPVSRMLSVETRTSAPPPQLSRTSTAPGSFYARRIVEDPLVASPHSAGFAGCHTPLSSAAHGRSAVERMPPHTFQGFVTPKTPLATGAHTFGSGASDASFTRGRSVQIFPPRTPSVSHRLVSSASVAQPVDYGMLSPTMHTR